jgi:hypothetical protein
MLTVHAYGRCRYDTNNARLYASPKDSGLLPVHVIVALFYLYYLVIEVRTMLFNCTLHAPYYCDARLIHKY